MGRWGALRHGESGSGKNLLRLEAEAAEEAGALGDGDGGAPDFGAGAVAVIGDRDDGAGEGP